MTATTDLLSPSATAARRADRSAPAMPPTFVERIIEHGRLRPDDVALISAGTATTFGELLRSATEDESRLAALGLEEGEPVAVLADKDAATVALLLACFATGRVVLLPAPTLPDRVIERLAASAGCRHVLEPGSATATAPAGGRPAAPPTPPGPADAASEPTLVMLTTSGSTGLPKVVPLPAAGVDRFVEWATGAFELGPSTTSLAYAPLTFDLSLLDVWATLASGGTAVMVQPSHALRGRHLAELIVEHDVTLVQAVPMALRLIVDGATTTFDRVRHVIFTGDAIPRTTLGALPARFPRARLLNLYGCTETNDSFVYEVDPDTWDAGQPPDALPIGHPLPGVEVRLLADDGEPAPPGAVGELWVSTPFQTTGYLDPRHRAARLARLDGSGRTFVRTGDLVQRSGSGEYAIVGRSDHQVKVRGVAVNTAEVERVLLDHPLVVEAAVVALPDDVGGRRLVAVVRRRPHASLNSLELREHCATRLNAAAAPASIRIGDEALPTTSTGKVDRRELTRRECDPP